MSGPVLRTFLAVADVWGLTEDERLRIVGSPSRGRDWLRAARERRAVVLPSEALMRLSAALGVYENLVALEGGDAEGVAWLRTPHGAPPFAGRPPIEFLTDGSQDALLTVRRFLDAARGGLYMAPNAVDEGFTPYEDGDIVLS